MTSSNRATATDRVCGQTRFRRSRRTGTRAGPLISHAWHDCQMSERVPPSCKKSINDLFRGLEKFALKTAISKGDVGQIRKSVIWSLAFVLSKLLVNPL
jgi:hypothetical protein